MPGYKVSYETHAELNSLNSLNLLNQLAPLTMQQFQVPQFIDIEDRIIGPLTLKQFLYLLGAAGAGIIGWSFLYFALFVIFAVPAAGLFVALAFLKINERPLPTVIFNAIGYYFKPRLYIWRQAPRKRETIKTPTNKKDGSLLAGAPKLSESKLNDIAWSLDIQEKIGDRQQGVE